MVFSYHPVNKGKVPKTTYKAELAIYGAGIRLDAHYEQNGPTVTKFVKPPLEHLQKPSIQYMSMSVAFSSHFLPQRP